MIPDEEGRRRQRCCEQLHSASEISYKLENSNSIR